MFRADQIRRSLRLEELKREGFEQGLAPDRPEPIGGMGWDAEEREVYRESKERGERAASKLTGKRSRR